ncbi:MAG: ABC-2 family transporter protein, partial [Candidatus Dojkabacteria bacterium]|nr:ABC-2 family transporter protein [Candidatus Dojkabacteria bacterium]
SILRGQLSADLIRPFKIPSYLLAKHLARVLSETIIHVLLVCPILLMFPNLLLEFNLDVTSAIQFAIAVSLASILNFSIFFTIGSAAFWTKEASGLQNVIRNSTRLFTGELMPVDLFPALIQKITFFLPFQYILYFPIKVLISEVSSGDFYVAILNILIWITSLSLVNIILWKFGLRQYEAVGI